MNPRKAKKILESDEDLNIAELAEAVLEDKKHEPKRKHIPSMDRSHKAWVEIQKREQKLAVFRKRLAKVWPSKKQS